MNPKKPKSEKRTRINITLHPLELKKLDATAKDMKTTRSGVVSYMLRTLQALDDNKDLNRIFELMITKALKK